MGDSPDSDSDMLTTVVAKEEVKGGGGDLLPPKKRRSKKSVSLPLRKEESLLTTVVPKEEEVRKPKKSVLPLKKRKPKKSVLPPKKGRPKKSVSLSLRKEVRLISRAGKSKKRLKSKQLRTVTPEKEQIEMAERKTVRSRPCKKKTVTIYTRGEDEISSDIISQSSVGQKGILGTPTSQADDKKTLDLVGLNNECNSNDSAWEDGGGASDLSLEVVDEGVTPYSNTSVTSFEKAALLIFESYHRDKVCTAVPDFAPQFLREISYIVDLNSVIDARDLLVDSHGSWGKNHGKLGYYYMKKHDELQRVDRDGKLPVRAAHHYTIRKYNFRHPATDGHLRKVVFVGADTQGRNLRWAVVSYLWDCDPFPFTPRPHGNSRHNLVPFQPMRKSAKTTLSQLVQTQAPRRAIAQYRHSIQMKGGGRRVPKAPEIPRNISVVYNMGKKFS